MHSDCQIGGVALRDTTRSVARFRLGNPIGLETGKALVEIFANAQPLAFVDLEGHQSDVQ